MKYIFCYAWKGLPHHKPIEKGFGDHFHEQFQDLTEESIEEVRKELETRVEEEWQLDSADIVFLGIRDIA